MGVIVYTNCDSATAGSLPTGWTGSGVGAVAAEASLPDDRTGGGKALRGTAGGVGTSQNIYCSSSQDDGSGNNGMEFYWYLGALNTANYVSGNIRITSAPFDTCYQFFLANEGPSPRVQIIRRSGGSAAESSSAVNLGAAWPTGTYYRVVCNSTSGGVLTLRVQRMDNGQYLTSAGAWSSTAQDVISWTVSSQITGAGYHGFRIYRGNVADFAYVDDITYVNGSIGTPVTVARSDSALSYSGYNWRDDGTGRISNTPGAWLKTTFSGSSVVRLNLSSPAFTGASLAIRAYVDGSQVYDGTVTAAAKQVTIAGGLSTSSHTLAIYYRGNDPTQDVWTTPTMACRITGLELETGGSVSAPTLQSGRMLWYGDSVSYGINSDGTTAPSGHDATDAPGWSVASALSCELSVRGFGSTGYGKTGLGNAPAAANAYSYYSNSQSIDFTTAPDRIVVYWGTADYTGSSTTGNMTTGCTSVIQGLRSACPSARIYCIVPACLGHNATTHNNMRAAIIAGFEAAAGTKISKGTNGEVSAWVGSTDPRAFLITLGETISANIWDYSNGATADSTDGIHPNATKNAAIATLISQGIALTNSRRRLLLCAEAA